LIMSTTEKTTLILMSGLALTACSPSNMSKAKQDFACEGRGGVYHYAVINNAVCKDGSYVRWKNLILPPEYYPDTNIKEE